MKKESQDKRVRRTKQSLVRALVELMAESGYEKLSVQQILDRASVGRATFYLHYRSKENLLRSSFDNLREQMMEPFHAGTHNSGEPLAFSLQFFQHVDSHRQLYKAIVGRESGAIVDRQMRRLLADLVRAEIGPHSRDAKQADLAAQYVAGALASIVTWWLDRNIRLTAEEINSSFRRMTLPALQAIR